MANKIQRKAVVSQSFTADNSIDESRSYDIDATINEAGGTINDIHGEVKKEGANVATFNTYGGQDYLCLNFNGTDEPKAAILEAVEDFIATAKEGGIQ